MTKLRKLKAISKFLIKCQKVENCGIFFLFSSFSVMQRMISSGDPEIFHDGR
jgi:hypothetical protein